MTATDLVKQLEEANRELAYYRRIAKENSDARLREAEEQSRLITKLKSTKKALEKAKGELEKRVQERTAALVNANHDLNQEVLSRVKIEEVLRKSEQRFRDLAELLPETIFETDQQGNLTFVNRKAFDHFGYTDHDYSIGLSAVDMIAPDDRKRAWENMQRIMKGESIGSNEYTLQRKDGGTFPARIHSTVIIHSGQPLGLRGFIVDITEHKRKEEALRLSNELFSLFIHHSPIYTYIKEVSPTQSIVLQASDNFRQMIGIPGCEMVGKSMTELFPSEFGVKITTDDWAVVSRGDVLQEDEELNGRSYTTIKFPIVRRDKTFLAGYTIDITERKQAEEEKRSMEVRLQHAEKMEIMGQLAGRVAHDLNNVLGVLSGYSELLMERIGADNPLRRYADNILKSSAKAAAIVEDLLTLARRGVRVMEVANFNKIIVDLLGTPEFDKLVAYHPGVIVKTDLARDLLNISGSPVHLEKTIMNLVSNAMEAIADSGEVKIKTENRYIEKSVEGNQTVMEGDYVVLTVSDTGKGIPAHELKRVFDSFYTKKPMGRSGTGLGLAIVQGAVKDHNGHIDVESIEEKGTTFTLYFPATREKAEAEMQKTPVEQYMGQGESVLVVDDVEDQRNVATDLFMQLGYQVNAVSSGEAAVEYMKSNNVDILAIDMIMEPGIDGLETYQQILAINPHQKAIIISGFSETDRSKEAQKLGAGAYVKKPYLKEKIGLAVRNELARE